MRLLDDYEILEQMLRDEKNIRQQLSEKPTEYYPREVRALNKQYHWTLISAERQCNKILNKEPDDRFGEEIDNRIRVEKILNKTKKVLNKIKW